MTNQLIGFLTVVSTGLGSPATSNAGRYEIICQTEQDNPYISHLRDPEGSYDSEKFRMWYAVGISFFRPVEIITGADSERILRGSAFDFRGRQTYLENKSDGTSEYTFFVLASEWSCSPLDNTQTTGD